MPPRLSAVGPRPAGCVLYGIPPRIPPPRLPTPLARPGGGGGAARGAWLQLHRSPSVGNDDTNVGNDDGGLGARVLFSCG